MVLHQLIRNNAALAQTINLPFEHMPIYIISNLFKTFKRK
ncbi:hypothetical protein SpAn4DRAFT_1699 [Sporomusa ovata]|uniref:Uncharacterized protein n=1 Tax=Sporomusa ovata TaxID=2378 RepID=A0A0U1KTH3_9FIRM|nr:hypothetical protein SpAn4DRAFT_1699 [Sporomusa ovata]